MLRRKSKFVVTPKGDSASPDRWFGTFRYHWYFITIFGGSIRQASSSATPTPR
ncbi:hypothetical protein SGLAM104S_00579 [Streptomyces glaucescens]